MRKSIYTIFTALILLTACQPKGEQFEINGQISAANGQTLHFEAITLTGIETIDSIKLDSNGEFQFYGPRPANPEFYRLRIGQQIINLSVDSTEILQIKAELPTMGTDYEIQGSATCEIIKELSNKQYALQESIKAILNNQTLTTGERARLINEQADRYKEELKRNYILPNPSSASAYFALFQTVGGRLLFNPVSNPDDIRFVGAVATAWDIQYPGAERTVNLHNIAIQGMKNTKRPTPVTLDSINPEIIEAAGIIDINLPDIDGKEQKLSAIKNKVILLDFTAYSLPISSERTIQMRALYDKYAAQGFEIYQISIDPDEHYWKTACEHLPWTCVYEKEGEESRYLTLYRVGQLPTYFIINRHGDLVARDEQIPDLGKYIGQLCKE